MDRNFRHSIICIVVVLTVACSSSDDAPPPPQPSVSLSVERSPIAPGQTALLSWTSNNATSCAASGGWSGSKGTSGSERTAALSDTTEFELTCSGAGGQASDSVTVSIDETANEVPQIEEFDSSAQTVDFGQAVTFSWNVSDPDGDPLSCVLDVTGVGLEFEFEDCSGVNSFEFTYDTPGGFAPVLQVSDGHGTTVERLQQFVSSEFMVTIEQPSFEGLVSSSVSVVARVSSPLEVAEVRTRVADREVQLVSSTMANRFDGTVSLDGLPLGPLVLEVVAEDIEGAQATSVMPFTRGQPPVLTIDLPLDDTVARPGLEVAITCVGSGPAGCGIDIDACTAIDFRDCEEGSSPFVDVFEGSDVIDTVLDLSAFDGRTITLDIHASSGGFVLRRLRTIHVESSEVLAEVEQVSSGLILDAKGSRLLHRTAEDSGDRLEITDTASMSSETVPLPEGTWLSLPNSFLTPYGAIFGAAASPFVIETQSRLYDWNSMTLEDLGPLLPVWSLATAGDFAIWWASGGTLTRRDLASRSQFAVSAETLLGISGVAANGAVAWSNDNYQIQLYSGGVTRDLTSDPDFRNSEVLTDGSRAVYRKFTPPGPDATSYAIILHDGTDEIVLREAQPQESEAGQDYQVVPGWVAYTDIGNLGQEHVWLYDPAEQRQQLTFFGSSSEIEKLGSNGEVMLLNGGKRHLALSDGTMTEIGTSIGEAFQIDGVWHVAIGRSLFQVLPENE